MIPLYGFERYQSGVSAANLKHPSWLCQPNQLIPILGISRFKRGVAEVELQLVRLPVRNAVQFARKGE